MREAERKQSPTLGGLRRVGPLKPAWRRKRGKSRSKRSRLQEQEAEQATNNKICKT